LGEYALDVLLFFVTLGIGWFVWTLVILGRGQTPAKQILNMRTIHLEDGEITSWGRNALREFIAKPIISFAAWFTFGILYLWLLWDKNNQELWDKMMDTVVVTDPYDKLKPVPLPPPQGRETAALPSSSAAPENPTFAPPQAPTHTEAPVQAEPAQDATPPETDQG
jgi:uncharacterized RDD family membrane protein YckC